MWSCEDCGEVVLEPCGGSNFTPKVDLIVLIDNSGSMGNVANTISNAAVTAIDTALAKCPVDLRVQYFGLEGTWGGTVFNSSQRTYIESIYGTGYTLPAADNNHRGLAQEQGANGIEDLSNLFDWRDNACKAIFYISDEELDSVNPQNDFANEDQVTLDAISAATTNGVTVFLHYVEQGRSPNILQNYTDLASDTGGSLIYSDRGHGSVTPQTYIDFMPQIICNACLGCELNQF